MKRNSRSQSALRAVAAFSVLASSAQAATTITSFDDFVPNAVYPSWSSGTVLATPTNYIVTATGYGSCWKQLGPPPVDGTGNTTLVLDVTLGGATGADTNLGVIVDLKDGDDTQISYRFYGRSRGQHLLVGNLFSTNVPATDNGMPITNNLFRIVTNSVGTTPGLDLANLWHLNLELDPYVYTFAPYTIAWNDLSLTTGSGGPTGVCAVVSAFDGVGLGGTYGGWTSQTVTPTNLQISATTFGGGWGPVTPNINTTPSKTLQLNVTLTGTAAANGKLGPIVVLEDGDGTQVRYTWFGEDPGTNKILTSMLSAGTIVQAGSVPGFDFTTIKFYHVQLDPSTYTEGYIVAWNDISIIGCEGGTTDPGLCATVSTFDGVGLGGTYGAWTSQTVTPTNLQITAMGYGGGFGAVTPPISTTSSKTLQLNVTLTAPAAANGKLGPIVVLEDGDGTQLRYTWYGQNPGTNMVLTNILSAGTVVQAGTTAGFDFSSIQFFHLQLDPSSFADAYTVAWNDLSITGCAGGTGDTGVCAVLSTFDDLYMAGDYGSWQAAYEVSTPTNWQMTATGFGGAYRSVYPSISTTGNRTLQYNLNLAAPTTANGKLGPLVVLEDGDQTQLRYAWYGQSPGTNLVLTSVLSAGVIAQAGTIPGFDFNTISYFHLQLDPSSYSGSYDIIANDLSIIGCPAVVIQIVSQSYDRASQQFTFTFTSETGATYAIQSATEITAVFTDMATDIPSGGTTTTITVSMPDPNKGFVRVRKQ